MINLLKYNLKTIMTMIRRIIYLRSDNIEIVINDKADEVTKEIFH